MDIKRQFLTETYFGLSKLLWQKKAEKCSENKHYFKHSFHFSDIY